MRRGPHIAAGALLAATLLAGCEATQQAADDIARARAKTVVYDVMAAHFPGVKAGPAIDCVIDAASAQEIVHIAGASLTGVTPGVTQEVLIIAQRPAAVQCLARNALALG